LFASKKTLSKKETIDEKTGCKRKYQR